MSQFRNLLTAALLAALSAEADGAFISIKMNGSTPPSNNYSIVNDYVNPPSVYILRPPTPPYTYDIYCYDGEGAPSDINTIQTQLESGYYGNVRVRVLNPSTGAPGAHSVATIYLANASGNYYSSVENSIITGNLGNLTVYKSNSNQGGSVYISLAEEEPGAQPGSITGIVTCYSMSQLKAIASCSICPAYHAFGR